MKKLSRWETLSHNLYDFISIWWVLEIVTMTDINYQLQLQDESVETFMTLLDFQILVKGCTNTS